MTERRKINNIQEIWDGNKLLIKDFSNLDLEGLDLSEIPSWEWEDCVFDNTSVKNTGIKFFPEYLKIVHHHQRKLYIKNCDFSDNDLSGFFKYNSDINYNSCDFSNTNIPFYLFGENNKLDSSCVRYDLNWYKPTLEINTIRNNPWLKFDSEKLLYVIKEHLNNEFFIIEKESEIENVINLIEEYLSYDQVGELKKLYQFLTGYLTKRELALFFKDNVIRNKTFKNLDLTDFDNELLEQIFFTDCTFENITCKKDIGELIRTKFPNFSFGKDAENRVNNILLPEINYDSWQSIHNNRVGGTPITFKTNLYLELGRACNANCSFCKNNFYSNNSCSLNKIKKTLKDVSSYINSVVIGRGEPTLRLDDVKKVLDVFKHSNIGYKAYDINKYIFTNGSCKYVDSELSGYDVKYNISRHAIDDEENANIFCLDKDKILSTKELEKFINNNKGVTLAATCFKGALDSKEKIIDYIKYALSIGCQSILLSDLMIMEDGLTNKRNNYNVNIDDNVFDEVIGCLRQNSFEMSLPIYSTGGYILTILKKGAYNISIKHYISKKELEDNWPSAYKRTFDLSIDPKGNLYENWHQTSGIVKKLK